VTARSGATARTRDGVGPWRTICGRRWVARPPGSRSTPPQISNTGAGLARPGRSVVAGGSRARPAQDQLRHRSLPDPSPPTSSVPGAPRQGSFGSCTGGALGRARRAQDPRRNVAAAAGDRVERDTPSYGGRPARRSVTRPPRSATELVTTCAEMSPRVQRGSPALSVTSHSSERCHCRFGVDRGRVCGGGLPACGRIGAVALQDRDLVRPRRAVADQVEQDPRAGTEAGAG
jgi:hypothetical protein